MVTIAFIPGLASAANHSDELGTFEREGDRFVGEETAFALDEDLPGIRNLTDQTTGEVVFDEVRLAEPGAMDWTIGFDTFTLSAQDRPGLLMVQDDAPPTFRAWFPGDQQGVWNLSLAPGISVQPVDESNQKTLMSTHDTSYELDLTSSRITYLVGQGIEYDPPKRVFTVRDLSLVYQADRVTVEGDDEGCREGPVCMRFQGFPKNPAPGDSVQLRFENEGTDTHGLWVAASEPLDGTNASPEEAIASIEEVPPGQTASVNFTVPDGAERLYLWDDRDDHEQRGESLRWELESASPGGNSGEVEDRTSTPSAGWLAFAVSSISAAILRTRWT